MVGSGTRKARAISAVVSPPSNSQRERELRLGRDGRMAAGEYQAQPVVVHVVLLGRFLLEQLHRGGLPLIAGRFAAQMIERAIARGGDDPAGGRGRHARVAASCASAIVKASCTASSASCDVAEKAHQDGDRTSVLAAENSFDCRFVAALSAPP